MDARQFEFCGADGITLVAEAWGDEGAEPVILAHGGGQTRHSWGGTARALARQGWYAIAYDSRGHGDSEWSADGLYSLELFAHDLAALAHSCSRPPALVGASLGGMSSMLCEGAIHPGTFASIVLVDVTPQLNHEGINNVFQFMSEHMREGFATLEEAADSVARYTGRPRKDDLSGLRKNLREREGRYYWHWDPNFFSMRDDPVGSPQLIVDAARNITTPIMLIRGRMSDVVTQAEVDDFLAMLPHAQYMDVADARHMVAGDRNDVFTAAVIEFLSELSTPA